MKVKIDRPSGFQGTVLDVEALPRASETVRIGDWEAEVIKVTHLPSANASGKRYRAGGDPARPRRVPGEGLCRQNVPCYHFTKI